MQTPPVKRLRQGIDANRSLPAIASDCRAVRLLSIGPMAAAVDPGGGQRCGSVILGASCFESGA